MILKINLTFKNMKKTNNTFQSFIDSSDLKKSLLKNGEFIYSINFAILFAKRRDCQKFLKEVKKNENFIYSSRKANLFRIEIVDANQEALIKNANDFLKIAASSEFSIITNFIH